MHRTTMRAVTMTLTLTGLLLSARDAAATTRSFVTVRDHGSFSGPKLKAPDAAIASMMKAYDASGAKRPDVISLWTTFPMDGNIVETLFDPLANDVQGIGLESAYPTPDKTGTFTSSYPPTRSVLLHNDVTQLAARASAQNAPVDGLARYLFLLELSHNWGPAVKLPAGDGGASPNELIGFDFHWSFWMDAGGSCAGGNAWKDGGDGTFSTSGQSPTTIAYSMLDLYLMGLADPSEVPPFGVLEGAVPPPGVIDPFTKKLYSAASFPWFGAAPFTVTATRRTITIEDIVAANGPRIPARSSGALDLGVVLMVKKTATDEEIAAFEEQFEPVAASLAPAFHDATHERGTMTNVTTRAIAGDADAGDAADAGALAATEDPASDDASGGCDVTPSAPGRFAMMLGLVAMGLLLRRRRSPAA